MLMNLDKRTWQEGLTLEDYSSHCNANHKTLLQVLDLVKTYNKSLEDEEKMTPEQLAIKNVGKMVLIGFGSIFTAYRIPNGILKKMLTNLLPITLLKDWAPCFTLLCTINLINHCFLSRFLRRIL